MNYRITSNKYILKGTRKWHDFMCSNISIYAFLTCFVLMGMFVLMVVTVCNCGVSW